MGHHIVQLLLAHPSCTAVAVISRNPIHNLFPGATYHSCSIDSPRLLSVLVAIQPHIIIHTASPLASNVALQESTTIAGTKNLLDCARATPSVRYFIYCSSIAAIDGAPYSLLTEEAATLLQPSKRHHDTYAVAKARADALVLSSNNPSPPDGSRPFRTAVLRPCGIVGEGDSQILPALLDAMKSGATHVQLGNNTSKFDFVYVGNVARAHLQLAEAMIREADEDHDADLLPAIAGEAFFITNGEPMLFWNFARLVWRLAGRETRAEDAWVVPMWVAMGVAMVAEWVVWAVSLGTRRPEKLTRAQMENCSVEKTFSIEKARTRLGYMPEVSLEEGVRRGVKSLFVGEAKRAFL